MKNQLINSIIATFIILFLTGCATPNDASLTGAELDTEVGVAGCNGCTNIKTFTSHTLQDKLFAVKDAQNLRTGQRIGASLQLVLSNRLTNLKGIALSQPVSMSYLATVTGPKAHYFEGEAKTDANHPYRFLIRLHHNSSFSSQNAYLVLDNDTYSLLPPFILDGTQWPQNCFNTGCNWDEYYVISAQVVNRLIAQQRPLTIFVGERTTRQVQSKDGLNASYETVPSGVFLETSPVQLQNFLAAVRKALQL